MKNPKSMLTLTIAIGTYYLAFLRKGSEPPDVADPTAIDPTTLGIVVALVVSILAAAFTGWQTYLFKRMLDVQKQQLESEKEHFLSSGRNDNKPNLRDNLNSTSYSK